MFYAEFRLLCMQVLRRRTRFVLHAPSDQRNGMRPHPMYKGILLSLVESEMQNQLLLQVIWELVENGERIDLNVFLNALWP